MREGSAEASDRVQTMTERERGNTEQSTANVGSTELSRAEDGSSGLSHGVYSPV